MIKIINVVGARPNFMKMAPIVEAMSFHSDRIQQCLVHTGQHYDANMSKAFFYDLGIPKPDLDLEVGPGSHAEQTARVMVAFERVCQERKPDLVLVVGDVNSTVACAITAKKLGISVAHVEAGLRSRDITMPEEINRICTDAISDYLFTTDVLANENLLREGISDEKIHFVGNVMIDTLLKHLPMAAELTLMKEFGLRKDCYATLTLHRPSNVDDPEILGQILKALEKISRDMPIVFPIHPRTYKMIEDFGYGNFLSSGLPARGIWAVQPLGYLQFLHLNMNAKLVLTDSGGLQEETTVLGVPCITLRPNTERPITCAIGTNQVVGSRGEDIINAAKKVLNNPKVGTRVPDKWDGAAAERIVDVLMASDL